MADVFPLRMALIITRDEEQTLYEEGLEIELVPVWKRLLADEMP